MDLSLRRFWLPVIGFWLVIALLLVGQYWVQAAHLPLFGDTDDAMRITTATDLLNGQAWQDLIQHRDNAPFGSSMHWSRLVDAPIALLIWAFGPDWAAVLWPPLLLLPLMALSVLVTKALVRDADTFTAMALPALTLVLNIEFLPGRVDHHNVQILLTEGLLLALIVARRRVWGGVAAAVLAATSLAIGLETLPLAAVAITAYALLWLVDPLGYRRALIGFGLGFAAAVTGHFLLATAPQLYSVVACDVVSIVYVVLAVAGGGGLALATLVGSNWALPVRFGLLIVLGGAALALTGGLFPVCLAGPYAQVDPAVMAGLFTRIAEAQPLWTRFAVQPAGGWAFAGPALLAVPLTAWIAWRERGESRISWLIVLGLLGVACLVMIMQIRGARLSAALALPAAAWLITAARRAYRERGGAGPLLGLVGSWLLFATFIQVSFLNILASGPAQAQSTAVEAAAAAQPAIPSEACLLGSSYAALAALPPSRIAAPIGISSHILRYTPHSVLSAGFHRNGQSILDLETFFGRDGAAAREIATARGLDYVVTCPASGDATGGRRWLKDAAGWGWLTPVSAPADVLQILRIAK